MTEIVESTHVKDELFETAFHKFLQSYPEYENTRRIDLLRTIEFSRLDKQNHIYLDSTGGGLYGETQVRRQPTIGIQIKDNGRIVKEAFFSKRVEMLEFWE
jgi:hypothetical protein